MSITTCGLATCYKKRKKNILISLCFKLEIEKEPLTFVFSLLEDEFKTAHKKKPRENLTNQTLAKHAIFKKKKLMLSETDSTVDLQSFSYAKLTEQHSHEDTSEPETN